MSYIETNPLKNSTIMFLYSQREEIRLDPDYQRMGGIWNLEKKQLLIDSIINDYDVPKLYFHEYSRDQKENSDFSFAVIDGRQRLETIWAFMDGKFPLSADAEYQKDPSVEIAGLSYEDIAKEFPKIRVAFDSFVLPVICVRTDDEDLIEDMFSRLNEAAPLNAAEKRNAIGGDLVAAIRTLATHTLFTSRVRFRNNRYQHREVSARMLLIEHSLRSEGLIDTKKVYLDALARDYREGEGKYVKTLLSAARKVAGAMEEVFTEQDELLQAQGNMVVYYLVFRAAIETDQLEKITRRRLIDFRKKLLENRAHAEKDYAKASFELLEYDRLTQQGTNDANNFRERAAILAKALGVRLQLP